MRKLKLCVFPHYNKCVDSNGEWDRTWDESYVYVIYDDEGFEVDGEGGYHTEEKAREAGEKRLRELKGIKEYVDNSEFEYGHNVNHNSEEI